MCTDLLVGPGTLTDIHVVLGQALVDLVNRGLLGQLCSRISPSGFEDLTTHTLLLLCLVGQRIAAQSLGGLFVRLLRLLDPLDVLQPQLGRNNLHIPDRVDIALDVDDLGVVKRTDTLEDTVDGTDVRQEGVTETGTGRGAGGETGNVDTCQKGRDFRFGLVRLAQPQETLVGNGDTGLFGVATSCQHARRRER